MTSSPGPTWYDLLGVAPDATPDEVKAAWRNATDKFEPGSGTSQFRLFNEAADVLLDPVKRAAYDAELAGTGDAAPDVVPVETPDEPETTPEVEAAETLVETDTTPDVEPVETPAAPADGLITAAGRSLSWVLVVCVPIIVFSVLTSVIAVVGLHVWKADVEGIVPQVRTAKAGPQATAAAERALTALLSYDYRHMEADRDRATRFLTSSYRQDYVKSFNLLIKGKDGTVGPAVKTKTIVTAEVLNVAVADAESDQVNVVVFVNQSSTKGGSAQPSVFQNRVVATMVRRGDQWLVADLKSY